MRNHTQVLAVDVRQGRAKAVLIRDRLSEKEERVEGSWIINATGPWADRVCQRSSIRTPTPMLGGVRGSHGLPRFAGVPDCAVYSEAVDGVQYLSSRGTSKFLSGLLKKKTGQIRERFILPRKKLVTCCNHSLRYFRKRPSRSATFGTHLRAYGRCLMLRTRNYPQ